MRSINLTEEERMTLVACYEGHAKGHVRKRAQSLLLSDRGWTVKQIAALHDTRTRTIYTWFNRWEDMGIVGLRILPGRGMKPKLSATDTDLVATIKKKRENSHGALNGWQKN